MLLGLCVHFHVKTTDMLHTSISFLLLLSPLLGYGVGGGGGGGWVGIMMGSL